MKGLLKITKEITPKEMYCGIGACPAIFQTNNESYVIIGKVIDPKSLGVENRIGKHEILVEVPKKLIDNKE